MNADERSRYFQELTRNLQHEGFTVKPETEDGLLPVEMEGQRLCQVAETGAVRYWKEDVSGDVRHKALNRVTDIARTIPLYFLPQKGRWNTQKGPWGSTASPRR